jgi:hypothetical protein
MKNFLTKTVVLICTAAIIFALLAGCAPAASSSTTATAPVETMVSATTAAASNLPGMPPDGTPGVGPFGAHFRTSARGERQ